MPDSKLDTIIDTLQAAGFTPYHREKAGVIYCADCLDVMKAMPDKCVDFIFTDPPYGHNNNNGDMIANWEAIYGGTKKVAVEDYRPIANDGPEANELFQSCVSEYARLLANPGCCCCCGGGGPDPQFARWSLWLDKAIPFKMMVVWDKGPMGMGHHYRRSYETVLVASQGSPCKWYDNSNRIENVIRPGYMGIAKIIPSADQHPTQKPIELPKHFIQLHTLPGEIVIDPFLGSGTTAVAAKQLGRQYIGIEIEERYCKIAVDRLRQEELPL
jgi:DNA modification methylase